MFEDLASGHQCVVLPVGFCDKYGPKKNLNALMYLLDILDTLDINWILIGYTVRTGNIPPVKCIELIKNNTKGKGRVKSELLVANLIEKSRF